MSPVPGVRYGYADTRFGQLHYCTAGDGPPLLCLHQTPRSIDEFRELIPLLAAHVRVVSMDTPGMGASPPLAAGPSIEGYADAAVALLDVLGIERASLYGHHTGGVIAVEVAARYPDRVDHLVLSSTPYVDEESRTRRRDRPPIDQAERTQDGSHLTTLWAGRRAFYPPDRPDLLDRYVHDLLAADDPEVGHRAVGHYCMETSIGQIVAPTLCIGASADPFAFGELEPIRSRITGATSAVVEGGTVALIEAEAPAVAAMILEFLGTSHSAAAVGSQHDEARRTREN